MLRIAICDNDQKFARNLESLVLRESLYLAVRVETEVFSDGKNLVESIRAGSQFHLILIDVVMKQVGGIPAVREIRDVDRAVLIIYISGNDSYLKELFEVEPFRFLSKPLDLLKFRRYLSEAIQRIDETEIFYQFTFNKEIQKVSLKDVVYFESQGRVVYIYLKNGGFLHFYAKLNEVEKEMVGSRIYFLRIHQSFLVNYSYIRKMNSFNVIVEFAGQDKELKISEDRQKKVRHQFRELSGGKAVIE